MAKSREFTTEGTEYTEIIIGSAVDPLPFIPAEAGIRNMLKYTYWILVLGS